MVGRSVGQTIAASLGSGEAGAGVADAVVGAVVGTAKDVGVGARLIGDGEGPPGPHPASNTVTTDATTIDRVMSPFTWSLRAVSGPFDDLGAALVTQCSTRQVDLLRVR